MWHYIVSMQCFRSDAFFSAPCSNAVNSQRLLVDQVECAGERQLDASLEQVDERRAGLDAGGKRTEEDVEERGKSSDRPPQEDEHTKPENTPTNPGTARHVCQLTLEFCMRV